ncbi:MAG: hypothetical protein M1827_001354 [Pycnora praestabilis]|nr:MAG: hypothetical protein M1827_001354 [Pycnora praestabilis]
MAGANMVGGPVVGMPMMNNGIGGPRGNGDLNDSKSQLNTYIYDYLLKNELWDCARALLQSEVSLNTNQPTKTSPGHRRDGDMNGIDDNGLDTDSKDDIHSKRPDDLPSPKVPSDCPEGSFLYDWWCLFWDIFGAQRKKPTKLGEGGAAIQYVQYTQQQQRMKAEQQQQLLRFSSNPQQMMAGQMNGPMGRQYPDMMRGMQQNGMNMGQNELRQKALQNSRNSTPQQMAQLQQMQHLKNQQLQMSRDNSDGDMNGQRPQSPSSADNAPSPSKRPRLEGAPFNAQPIMPNGRGQPQGMPGQPAGNASAMQANQLLVAHGINPNQLTPSQFNSFQQQNPTVQQKSIQVYAQNLAQHQRSALNNQTMPKGIPPVAGVPNQGSPMMHQGSDGQNLGPGLAEFYAGNLTGNTAGNPAALRGIPGAGGQGNHALQDYQLQLMLLEQQNKKRLMMARQEQDSAQRPDGQPGPAGQFPPGMSPQGSRSGPSPNPNDQMKRGTPKMNASGLPGSPLGDGMMPQTRGSPAFQPGQMAPDIAPGFNYNNMKQMENMMGGAPNGAVMRPPGSMPPGYNAMTQQQFEALSRQQQQQVGTQQQQQQAGVRVPGAGWQQAPQGQMMPQAPQGQQPQAMGTPRQPNAMPPPQAPPVGANTNGRTQPSSPQQSAAPPTPQQSNKANPKGKKEGKAKPASRKGKSTAAATPSSEAEPPPTPTPSTPITPVHAKSFSQGQNGTNQAVNAQAPTSAPAPTPLVPPQSDPNQQLNFPIDSTDNGGFNLDFGPLEGADVLESFDFDSYLTEDGAGGPLNFDPSNFDPSLPFSGADGVEAGAGDI